MKKAKSNPWLQYGKMFLFTTLAATAVTIVLLLVSALLLDKLGLSKETMRLVIYGIYIISGLTVGLLAGKWQRERKFFWGLLAGVVWMVVVLIASLLVNSGAIEVKELFPAVVCMAGGGMLGGMLA